MAFCSGCCLIPGVCIGGCVVRYRYIYFQIYSLDEVSNSFLSIQHVISQISLLVIQECQKVCGKEVKVLFDILIHEFVLR